MNPTKFPPKNQSLLALGMSLACGRPLGGGVEGRLGVNWEDGFVVFLLEVIHSTPQGVRGFYVGTGTVKFLLIVNWALVSESNAVFINWTDFKKQNTKNKKE